MSVDSTKTKAFWLRYGLGLAEVLVVVAYLLPWRRMDTQYKGLLEWMYHELTHDPSGSVTFFIAALLACVVATIVSILLTIVVYAERADNALLLRASSMLNSAALAGPLLYIHRFLPASGSGWSDLWHAIEETDVGWCVALLLGSVASLLSLYMYDDARRCHEASPRSKQPGKHGPHLIRSFIAPVFMVVTILGFFLTWSSGSARSWWGETEWSVSGFEVSLLMYLVPATAFLSYVLSVNWDAVTMMSQRFYSQASHNLTAMTFALTLSWGLAFGQVDSRAPDMGVTANLELGWYLCTIGLLIVLACALLPEGLGPQDVKKSSHTPLKQHS